MTGPLGGARRQLSRGHAARSHVKGRRIRHARTVRRRVDVKNLERQKNDGRGREDLGGARRDSRAPRRHPEARRRFEFEWDSETVEGEDAFHNSVHLTNRVTKQRNQGYLTKTFTIY